MPDRNYIDRTPQNIPMPLGDFDVVHKNTRASFLTKWWHRNMRAIIGVLGAALISLGAYEAYTAPPLAVYLLNGSIVVGGNTLTETSPGVFSGAATYVLTYGNGTVIATAATEVDGIDVEGHCVMNVADALSVSESCVFKWGSEEISSQDNLALDGTGLWTRTYSNGTVVVFEVPANAGAVPVPFPIGITL